jgi:hypothetical protein
MTVAALLPLLGQLRSYLEEAKAYAETLKGEGRAVDPDVVALYLSARMAGWAPKIRGTSILDTATRLAAARFLAGVATNLVDVANNATRSHA